MAQKRIAASNTAPKDRFSAIFDDADCTLEKAQSVLGLARRSLEGSNDKQVQEAESAIRVVQDLLDVAVAQFARLVELGGDTGAAAGARHG